MKTDVDSLSELSTTGVYILLIFVSKEITTTIGKLGTHTFPQGFYTYTGSAHGKGATNLKNRIARHTKKQKKKFWHIDYLLANKNAPINAVVAAETAQKIECTLNNYLKSLDDSNVPITQFGASDCKNNCKSHLMYFPELKNVNPLIQKIAMFLESSSEVVSVVIIE